MICVENLRGRFMNGIQKQSLRILLTLSVCLPALVGPAFAQDTGAAESDTVESDARRRRSQARVSIVSSRMS